MKSNRKMAAILFVTAVAFVLFISIYPNIFFELNSWKTQTTLFKNVNDNNARIELQFKDKGGLGIKRRIVNVNKWLFFESAQVIDTSKIDKTQWKFVNEDVNELGIKFP